MTNQIRYASSIRERTAKGCETEYCDTLIYHPYNWNSSNALKEGWEQIARSRSVTCRSHVAARVADTRWRGHLSVKLHKNDCGIAIRTAYRGIYVSLPVPVSLRIAKIIAMPLICSRRYCCNFFREKISFPLISRMRVGSKKLRAWTPDDNSMNGQTKLSSPNRQLFNSISKRKFRNAKDDVFQDPEDLGLFSDFTPS